MSKMVNEKEFIGFDVTRFVFNNIKLYILGTDDVNKTDVVKLKTMQRKVGHAFEMVVINLQYVEI